MRVRRMGRALTVLALVAVAVGGCGSSGDGFGVASAGGNADTSATPSPTPTAVDRDEQLRQFAQCMRDNGVNVNDPQPGAGFGGAGITASGIDRNDPKVQAAFAACQSKLPNGGQPPKLNPQQVEQYRIFAQCMRDNGVDVPDPSADGTLQLGSGTLRGLDDPAFSKALDACRDKLTGLRPGGGPGQSGGTN